MIIKIKSRKTTSFKQLITYILKAEERVSDSHTIIHNLTGSTIESWVQQFEENETHRNNKRKNSVILTHEILSWHPKDAPHLTSEAIEDMAREYIRLRNPNGLFVGAIHLDKDHFHVHFCVSGVEYKSGKVMRLTKAELNRLKQTLQTYQQEKYPELDHSLPNHGGEERESLNLSDREYHFKKRSGQATTREFIQETIMQLRSQYPLESELLAALRENGLRPYFRLGTWQGVSYKGRKYRLTTLGVKRVKQKERSRRSRGR